MKLKSKAKTLKDLRLKYSKVPILKIFKCENFMNNKKKILDIISNTFKGHLVAIRSSFENEDTQKVSNAGKFNSFININSSDKIELEKKITEVIHSKKKLLSMRNFLYKKWSIMFLGQEWF